MARVWVVTPRGARDWFRVVPGTPITTGLLRSAAARHPGERVPSGVMRAVELPDAQPAQQTASTAVPAEHIARLARIFRGRERRAHGRAEAYARGAADALEALLREQTPDSEIGLSADG